LGAGSYEFFNQYGADIDRNSARNDPEILRKAKTTGAGLVSST